MSRTLQDVYDDLKTELSTTTDPIERKNIEDEIDMLKKFLGRKD